MKPIRGEAMLLFNIYRIHFAKIICNLVNFCVQNSFALRLKNSFNFIIQTDKSKIIFTKFFIKKIKELENNISKNNFQIVLE